MTTVSLVMLLAQLLPTIANDAVQVSNVLGAGKTAIDNAQAGDGTVSAADVAAIDAAIEADLTQFAKDAGIPLPAAIAPQA